MADGGDGEEREVGARSSQGGGRRDGKQQGKGNVLHTESTPTRHSLPFRGADFVTLAEALDYAADGDTGTNFYSGRGQLYAALSYSDLRAQ